MNDFYSTILQTKVALNALPLPSPVPAPVSTDTKPFTSEDVGERFMQIALKAAVMLADTGIQTAQQIIQSVGTEVLESLNMKPQTVVRI